MTKKKKQLIKPSYIKNAQGKVTEIYLDIKTYEAIKKRIEKTKKEKIQLKQTKK